MLETNICINLRDQFLYRCKKSISISISEIDVQGIDLSIDLRINLVLMSEIYTQINYTIKSLVYEVSSKQYCSLCAISSAQRTSWSIKYMSRVGRVIKGRDGVHLLAMLAR